MEATFIPTDGNVRFTIAEDQIVKLFHDRPEGAYLPVDAPTEFLREFCAWNDRNGDYDDLSREDLLTIVTEWVADDYYVKNR